MRNERGAGSTGHRPKTLMGHITLFVLAGALAACGKSSSTPPPPPGGVTLQSIAVVPASVTVATGTQQQFTVVGTYSDNSKKTITSGIDWSSSSPVVAQMTSPG